jgi:hypothetical protein
MNAIQKILTIWAGPSPTGEWRTTLPEQVKADIGPAGEDRRNWGSSA